MKNKLLNFLSVYRIPFLAFLIGFIYFYVVTIIFDPTQGDYKVFIKDPITLGYGFERWFTWSSRVFIESSVNIFSKHLLFWQLLTSLAGGILLYSFARIMALNRVWQLVVMTSLLCLVNINMFATAGVFATVINYVWPIAALAFAASVLIAPYEHKTVRYISYLVCTAGLIFAVCNEQIALFAAIVLGVLLIKSAYSRQRISRLTIVFFCIAVIGVVNILLSPGNDVRTTQEVTNWWIGFGDVSILSKFITATTLTFSRLVLAPELLVTALIIGLLALAYKKKNLNAFVAVLPSLVISIVFVYPANASDPGTFVRVINFFNEVRQQALFMQPAQLLSSEYKLTVIASAAIVTVSIIVAVIMLYGRSRKAFWMVTIMCASIIVSLAIAFSPTMFASVTRPVILLIFVLLLVTTIIWKDCLEEMFYDRTKNKDRVANLKSVNIGK